jgi:hypothetical protein
MKKLLIVATLAAAIFQLNTAQAGIFGRRWNRQTYPAYQAYSGYYAPAARTAAPPAPAYSANGYRSYSYLPEPNPNEAAEFQPFNPAYGYPTQEPRNETGEPYHDAGFKIRGF